MWVRSLALVVMWSGMGASVSSAQTLHVYGPDGSPTERRLFAVLADPQGVCVPASEVELSVSDAGVGLEAISAAGCVTELRIRASEAASQVTLEAEAAAWRSSASVAMGPQIGLDMRAVRQGAGLRVQLPGRVESADVWAHWSGGSQQLERSSRVYRARVPRDELVVVVARAGDQIGVSALMPDRGLDGQSVLVVPTQRAVPSSGVPRAAAFVVVTDTRGRLSRAVPLRIQSELGTLRALTWVDDGVASVVLSTTATESALDLRVTLPGLEEQVAQIPIVSGWPARANIEIPSAAVIAGERFPILVGGHTLAGDRLGPERLRVRCGDGLVEVSERGDATCVPSSPGPFTVEVLASVDGGWVPLESGSVQVQTVPDAPDPTEAVSNPISLRVHARGGIDTWARFVGGAGAGVAWRPLEMLGVTFDARYGCIHAHAEPAEDAVGVVQGALDAADHLVALSLGLELHPLGPLVVAGSGGVELSFMEGTLDAVPLTAFDARPFAEIAGGVNFEVESFQLGARLGVWLGAEQVRAEAWGTAPVRVFAEVVGALTP